MCEGKQIEGVPPTSFNYTFWSSPGKMLLVFFCCLPCFPLLSCCRNHKGSLSTKMCEGRVTDTKIKSRGIEVHAQKLWLNHIYLKYLIILKHTESEEVEIAVTLLASRYPEVLSCPPALPCGRLLSGNLSDPRSSEGSDPNLAVTGCHGMSQNKVPMGTPIPPMVYHSFTVNYSHLPFYITIEMVLVWSLASLILRYCLQCSSLHQGAAHQVRILLGLDDLIKESSACGTSPLEEDGPNMSSPPRTLEL